MMNIKIVL